MIKLKGDIEYDVIMISLYVAVARILTYNASMLGHTFSLRINIIDDQRRDMKLEHIFCFVFFMLDKVNRAGFFCRVENETSHHSVRKLCP